MFLKSLIVLAIDSALISSRDIPNLLSIINSPIRPEDGPITGFPNNAAYPKAPLERTVNLYGINMQSEL